MIIPYKIRIQHKLSAVAARIMGTITHVSTQDTVAALTFDDGPDPEWTPRLLDILESYEAKATFFMIGKCAQRSPEVVQQVAQAGHAIGNHSWSHLSLPLLSAKERREQIRACADAIKPYGLRLFRPPYGHQSVASRLDLILCGYKVVTWNLLAYDWEGRDAGWTARHLENKIRPGSIILLHDAIRDQRYNTREPMLDAVKMFLERVGDKFSFITIPDLFNHGKIQKCNWYLEPDIEWLKNINKQEC